MYKCLQITDLYAREILDSRGNPTLEVEVLAGEKYWGRASVPSGASRGAYEALELRDGGERQRGLGVENAVDHVNCRIAEKIIGMNVLKQAEIDNTLIGFDGTKDKSCLGANALLGVSLAVARTAAKALEIPLFAYLGGSGARMMPMPMMNIINGGKHGDNRIDIQEFLIIPVGSETFREGLFMCSDVYHALKDILRKSGKNTNVGDEGGFAPDYAETEEVLEVLVKAIEGAGFRPGTDVALGMDAAASTLYDRNSSAYFFRGEGRERGKRTVRTSEDVIAYFDKLAADYPLVSLEDPLAEDDWEGWQKITEILGKKLQIVGDDLYATNEERIAKGIEMKASNGVLIKANQIGTLTETLNAVRRAAPAGMNCIISHRSGETGDTMISDLSVALGAGQIKAGAPCRGERTEKYNRLLRIEETLGAASVYSRPFDSLKI